MAHRGLFVLFCFYSICCLLLLATSGQEVEEEVCDCDFTQFTCDLNCCCDKNCTKEDLDAFRCDEKASATKTQPIKYCVRSKDLYFSNTPYILKEIEDLICVVQDVKYDYRETFSLEEERINELASSINSVQSSLDNFQLNETDESFKAFDKIWIIYPNDLVSYLTIPSQVASTCTFNTPVTYLNNRNTNCQTPYTCASVQNSVYDLNLYQKQFKIIPRPNELQKCKEKPGITSLYNECENLVSVELRTCTGPDQSEIPNCQISTQGCSNMVKSLKYIFAYTNPFGISEAYLDVEFINVDPNDLTPITQKFEIVYVPVRDEIVEPVKVSGNPGYIKGEPVLAGTWNLDTLTINENRDLWFTTFKSTANGCGARTTIKFGINVANECFQEIRFAAPTTVSDMCTQLQDSIVNTMLGPLDARPSHVASFGNLVDAETTNVTDWIKLNDELPKYDQNLVIETARPVRCPNLVVSMDIVVASALIGNNVNPQAKIVYANYVWTNRKQDYVLQCANTNPLTNCVAKVLLSSKVTFVDVTIPPANYEGNKLRRILYLPNDFLSPLISSARGSHVGLSLYKLMIVSLFLVLGLWFPYFY